MNELDRLLDDVIDGSNKVLAELSALAQRPAAKTWQNRAVIRGAVAEVGKVLETLLGDDSRTPSCSVIDAKGRAEAKLFRYRVEPAGLLERDYVQKGAWDLGLREVPEVFCIRKCADGEKHDIVNYKNVLGLFHKRRNEIYVDSGLGLRDTIETLGHELWHCKERQDGLTTDENACDDYGRRFADWIMYGQRT